MNDATSILNAPAGTPPAADPAAAAPAAEWFSGIQDENVRTWAAGKGWKDPIAAVESNYNLEKLIGFEKAGRTIVLPKEDATPEERAQFFQKIGAPADVSGYKTPESMATDPMVAAFREQALKTNMLPQQFEETLSWYQQQQAATQKAEFEARAAAGEKAIGDLRGEWGAAYDQNIELAKRAANQFLPAKSADERKAMMGVIEAAVGTEAMLRFFSKIGEGLGEDRMHTDGDPGTGDVMTPAVAKAKIEALKNDKEWAAAYVKGDAGKREEMSRLHKFAYPEAA